MSERYQSRMNTTFYTPPEMFHTESTLRYKLRNLMLSHSPQEIYSTLRQMLEEDYTFLQTLFAQPEPEQARAPVQPQPPASASAAHAHAQQKQTQEAEAVQAHELARARAGRIGSEGKCNLPLTSGARWNRFLGDCAKA